MSEWHWTQLTSAENQRNGNSLCACIRRKKTFRKTASSSTPHGHLSTWWMRFLRAPGQLTERWLHSRLSIRRPYATSGKQEAPRGIGVPLVSEQPRQQYQNRSHTRRHIQPQGQTV